MQRQQVEAGAMRSCRSFLLLTIAWCLQLCKLNMSWLPVSRKTRKRLAWEFVVGSRGAYLGERSAVYPLVFAWGARLELSYSMEVEGQSRWSAFFSTCRQPPNKERP